MDETSPVRPSATERLRQAWQATRLWFIFMLGVVGTTLALSLPISQRTASLSLQVGQVAPQDILAPYALSFESQVLTEQARQAAAEAVPEVYDPPDGRVARRQIERLRAALDYIEAVRNDPHATETQKLADLAALTDLRLDSETARWLLNLPENRWAVVRQEAVSVLEQVMRDEIREDHLEEVRRAVPALVSVTVPEEEAAVIAKLVSAFVAPNALFNRAATEAAREEARRNVPPVVKSYAPGETIISRGEVVQPIHLEALEAYGLLRAPNPWREIALRGTLVTILAVALVLYVYRVHPEEARSTRLALLLSLGFIVSGLTMQMMVPGRTVLPYLYPAASLPMLLAILFSPGMGVLSALMVGAMAGFLSSRGLELALYASLSGTLGALMVGRAERLSSFFWAGLASALAGVAVVVVFRFPDPGTDMVGKASLLGAAMVNGLLSASLGFGLLLFTSSLLGITTTLQLIELARPDHPLLQFILRNAPGTYQHSLQVANLAEQAARAIGANPLLTRVGALYHDAGKALRPHFFIENQMPGQNIHEQLDPTTSASIILAHVRDGLELARKYHLPKRIQDFILEHHGTLEATYQYEAALQAAGGKREQVDRRDFTYPGPRPRSKETALIMLADGVEAKARAEVPQTEEEIENLVRWVIQDRLAKGQLDRTDLTLRDLDTIRRSFVNTLKGMYHPRLRYPAPEEASDREATPQKAPQPAAQPDHG